MADLFAFEADRLPPEETLAPGATLLRGFAVTFEPGIQIALEALTRETSFRHMTTPGGFRMSVAMTNCGALGWVADRAGYRYTDRDPESGNPWPAMPGVFALLARQAALKAGFREFEPDACLVNRYEPGARLSLHQDRDERDFSHPIVSVSLGLPATFLFGGERRKDRPRPVPVSHGDVIVWGGPARLRYHGVKPLAAGRHPTFGECRINLTLRRAG
jgi:alkylated DNA repair protein (DNA oxidative demethylase)